jgi:hypothetical protein
MKKFCHMCYGCCFVWVTDCYAVKFILSYDGANQAILCLQMWLMGWNVDIVHCRNKHLVDANYWSHLDSNICYDPLFCTYLRLVDNLRRDHSAPTEICMIVSTCRFIGALISQIFNTSRIAMMISLHHGCSRSGPSHEHQLCWSLLLTHIVTSGKMDFTSLLNCPVQFGTFSPADTPDIRPISRVLYNSELSVMAYSASHFPWAVYGFNLGHFISTIEQRNFPFSIGLACNPYAHGHGRALLHEVAKC